MTFLWSVLVVCLVLIFTYLWAFLESKLWQDRYVFGIMVMWLTPWHPVHPTMATVVDSLMSAPPAKPVVAFLCSLPGSVKEWAGDSVMVMAKVGRTSLKSFFWCLELLQPSCYRSENEVSTFWVMEIIQFCCPPALAFSWCEVIHILIVWDRFLSLFYF